MANSSLEERVIRAADAHAADPGQPTPALVSETAWSSSRRATRNAPVKRIGQAP